MEITRRNFIGGIGAFAGATALAACGNQAAEETATEAEASAETASSATAPTVALNQAAWLYNADDDVYYQLGISYCATPAESSYEQLAIFVPGAYFEATDNGDSTSNFIAWVKESLA